MSRMDRIGNDREKEGSKQGRRKRGCDDKWDRQRLTKDLDSIGAICFLLLLFVLLFS